MEKTIEERLAEIQSIDRDKTRIEGLVKRLLSTPMEVETATNMILYSCQFTLSPRMYSRLRGFLLNEYENEQRDLINEAYKIMKSK